MTADELKDVVVYKIRNAFLFDERAMEVADIAIRTVVEACADVAERDAEANEGNQFEIDTAHRIADALRALAPKEK